MSLYGAMYSGVSALSAQASALGAISDNISNVNTVGYKSTNTKFASLVTKQVSLTKYSPGGVQSAPRAGIDVQGLLSSTSSATDIAISGNGFFVVNEAPNPSTGDVWAYTRAGSFKVDADGYLVNTGGFYLQAWPTLPDGSLGYYNEDGTLVTINPNVVSAANLKPINLNSIGGTATATTKVEIDANLPAAAAPQVHTTDVLVYDSLGTAQNLPFVWSKTGTNTWDLSVVPPQGSASLKLYNDLNELYAATGRIDFSSVPAAGTSFDMTINGATYTFNFDDGTGVDDPASGQFYIDVQNVTDLATIVDNLSIDMQTAFETEYGTVGVTYVEVPTGSTSVAFHQFDTANDLTVNIDQTALLDADGNPATFQGVFTLEALDLDPATTNGLTFNGNGSFNSSHLSKMNIDWVNGANDSIISLNLGTANLWNGLTQLDGPYTPKLIVQDGAKFGNFAGISIGSDGMVTALFDNGETRKIYKIPVATFVNPNGLDGMSGNAWIETDFSGTYSLRSAGEAGAGTVEAASLESSTVDLGEEFTNMIVTQRAYSAAAKMITTADEMLDELIRIKR